MNIDINIKLKLSFVQISYLIELIECTPNLAHAATLAARHARLALGALGGRVLEETPSGLGAVDRPDATTTDTLGHLTGTNMVCAVPFGSCIHVRNF
jgi:hypothetical protein